MLLNWLKMLKSCRTVYLSHRALRNFYVSITGKILDIVINFAKNHSSVDAESIAIKPGMESLLFSRSEGSKKKSFYSCFDIVIVYKNIGLQIEIETNLHKINFLDVTFKGPLLSLRHFLTTESHLKMVKNAFYFMLKALFVLEILIFCLDILVI